MEDNYIDVDLMGLALTFLVNKGKPWTVVDLLEVCSSILKKAEGSGNRYKKGDRKFYWTKDGLLHIADKKLKKLVFL